MCHQSVLGLVCYHNCFFPPFFACVVCRLWNQNNDLNSLLWQTFFPDELYKFFITSCCYCFPIIFFYICIHFCYYSHECMYYMVMPKLTSWRKKEKKKNVYTLLIPEGTFRYYNCIYLSHIKITVINLLAIPRPDSEALGLQWTTVRAIIHKGWKHWWTFPGVAGLAKLF